MSDETPVNNVTQISLSKATAARAEANKYLEAREDEGLETFVSIAFFKDREPSVTHNTASVERLLYAAEVIRQYALGAVGATPEQRGN